MDGLAELCTAIVEHGRLAKLSPVNCCSRQVRCERDDLFS